MRAYDCDGTCYPCQFFLPICVGDEKAKASLTLDFSNFRLADNQIDEKCKTCYIRNTCPTCYGNNYATTGNIYRRDMRLCKMNIIQFQAISYFAAKRFELGQLGEYKPDEQAAILKSALSILKELTV
jgi:radical SAM protein with 4Fe4S-binding SPASM domain